MINKLMKLKNNKKGFTLIELIVVIAILGILAAIIIPSLAGFSESAKQATDKEAAAVVCNAAAMYYASNPKMAVPADTAAWEALLVGAKLIKATDYVMTSDAFTPGGLTISGPASGVITVTLVNDVVANNYTITK